MTEMLIEAGWLLDGRISLMRLRQECWLTEAEIAIIENGIAALDTLISEAFAE
jgi:hypothetical protein